jgi:C_GCAxxG_C_C family probable redox protein
MNSLYGNREAALTSLNDDFLRGHHCSEMIFVKLGQYYDESFDPRLMRLATGFGGGIAEAADVCGAVVGGVMLIGHLYGRTGLHDDQQDCWRYAPQFRDRFEQELGGTSCYHFTQGEFNPANHRKCADVVKTAAEILLDILPPPKPKRSS